MTANMNRRRALRAAAALGAAGAGVALGSRGAMPGPRAALATRAGPRTLRLEIDMVAVNGFVFSREGGVRQPGVPTQQGDHCNIALRMHHPDDLEGDLLGDAHCLGPFVGSATERGALGPGYLVTTWFDFHGRGKLSGLVYCRADEWWDGAITGGTAAFLGAWGSFRWMPRMGAEPWRVTFDIFLPDLT